MKLKAKRFFGEKAFFSCVVLEKASSLSIFGLAGLLSR